jgi:hypothetical protein
VYRGSPSTAPLTIAMNCGAVDQPQQRAEQGHHHRAGNLEPGIIVLVGAVVGFIVISMCMRLVKVYDAIK